MDKVKNVNVDKLDKFLEGFSNRSNRESYCCYDGDIDIEKPESLDVMYE